MSDTKNALPSPLDAALLLADGTVFSGVGIGAQQAVFGEICFNTAMTGYQEVLSDPSYNGQIVTFTFPHIGNVGCNGDDVESRPALRNAPLGACGLVIREPVTNPSNFRSTSHLDAWLSERGIAGISGIDTRALTRHIRKNGAQNAAIVRRAEDTAPEQEWLKEAKAKLAAHPSLEGMELTRNVTTKQPFTWDERVWSLIPNTTPLNPRFHVVAIDYGAKLNILRLLTSYGCKVTVVPAETSVEAILALKPDGVFLSNGPGDPAATGRFAIPVIHTLIEKGLPMFGICLGHQLIGLACGGKTEKMHQGHRGANHPIKNLLTGKVEITSQNHGFTVTESSLPSNVEVTHKSLFDGTVAGLRLKGKPVFCVQYHPEASPGPHDSLYLFEAFVQSLAQKKAGAL